MISIIIPSRNEPFLQKTIEDILAGAEGEIQVIAVLDGYWPQPPLGDDRRLILIHRGKSRGMRNAINSAAAIAKGEYIMKTDAHCMFDRGFDTKLAADCEDNWVAVPRRKRLDAENWCIQAGGKPDIDYMYLSYPYNRDDRGGKGLKGKVWREKNRDEKLKKRPIDDLITAQGSCWFMKRKYFYELELMDEKNYGTFWNEFQEIGLKCWLSGGRVVVNKKTWYAHLHKGKKYGRAYRLEGSQQEKGARFANRWMEFGEAWKRQTLPMSWLIEKFWPVPGWPEDKKLWAR